MVGEDQVDREGSMDCDEIAQVTWRKEFICGGVQWALTL